MKGFSILSVMFVLVSCQYSYLRSPRPLKKNTVELNLSLNWLIDAVEPAGSKWYVPMPSFSVFYSPVKKVDVGMSVYPVGVEVSGRYAFVDSGNLTAFSSLRLGKIFVGGIPLEKSLYIEPGVQVGYKVNESFTGYGVLRGTLFFSKFGERFTPAGSIGLEQFIGGKSFWLWEFNAMFDKYAPFSFASGYRWRSEE